MICSSFVSATIRDVSDLRFATSAIRLAASSSANRASVAIDACASAVSPAPAAPISAVSARIDVTPASFITSESDAINRYWNATTRSDAGTGDPPACSYTVLLYIPSPHAARLSDRIYSPLIVPCSANEMYGSPGAAANEPSASSSRFESVWRSMIPYTVFPVVVYPMNFLTFAISSTP